MFKKCNLCQETLPLEHFNKNSKGSLGHYSYCKSCHKVARTSHKGKVRDRFDYYIRHYGVSKAYIENLFYAQGQCCSICSKEISLSAHKNSDKAACVDHDHTTNKIRSILCNHCNRGLGMFRDNVDSLRRAADYLVAHGK